MKLSHKEWSLVIHALERLEIASGDEMEKSTQGKLLYDAMKSQKERAKALRNKIEEMEV